jgi:hypothetical protein
MLPGLNQKLREWMPLIDAASGTTTCADRRWRPGGHKGEPCLQRAKHPPAAALSGGTLIENPARNCITIHLNTH